MYSPPPIGLVFVTEQAPSGPVWQTKYYRHEVIDVSGKVVTTKTTDVDFKNYEVITELYRGLQPIAIRRGYIKPNQMQTHVSGSWKFEFDRSCIDALFNGGPEHEVSFVSRVVQSDSEASARLESLRLSIFGESRDILVDAKMRSFLCIHRAGSAQMQCGPLYYSLSDGLLMGCRIDKGIDLDLWGQDGTQVNWGTKVLSLTIPDLPEAQRD